MDHFGILKRALRITWDYRVLWIFGFIIALTSGGGGGNAGGSSGGQSRGNFAWPDRLPKIDPTVIIGAVIACCLLLVVLTILGAIAHYVAQTALIRLVDEYEGTGQKRTFREGWRLGWDRRAFRLFLMQLIVGLPLVLAFLVGMLVAAAPLLLWVTQNESLGILGTVIAVGLLFLVILLAVLVGFVLTPWLELAKREIALRERGVFEALRRAWSTLRRRPADAYIMALILVAVNWALMFVTIPLFIVIFIVGAVVAAIPALLVGGIAYAAGGEGAGLIAALVVGVPVFILAIAIPAAFIGGLIQVFSSSTWTLTYRELNQLLEAAPAEIETPVEPIEPTGEAEPPAQEN